jgi:hypothetical protein
MRTLLTAFLLAIICSVATAQYRSVTLTNYLNTVELDSLMIKAGVDTVYSRSDTLRAKVHNGAGRLDTLFGTTNCFASASIQQGTWLMAEGGMASAFQNSRTKLYVLKKVNDSTLVVSDTLVLADTTTRFMVFRRPDLTPLIAGKPFYAAQWDLALGLPTVSAWVDSVRFIASRKPTSTALGSASAWASFAAYKGSNTQSGAGDHVGLPMELPSVYGRKLSAAFLTDSSGQSGNVDVAFFSRLPAFDGDNAAFAASASEMRDLIAYIPLTTSAVSGSSVMYARDLNLPIVSTGVPQQQVWVLLVSRGTQTYTGGSPLRLRLVFE